MASGAPPASWQTVHRPWWRWLRRFFAMSTGETRSTAAAARQGAVPGVSGTPDFDAFFTRYEGPVFGYVRRIVATEDIAVEIVQETFLRAWVHFATIRDYERPQAWLYRVATRLALNQRRDHHTIAFAELPPLHPGEAIEERWADPLDLEGQSVARDTINRVLAALPERQRAALLLRVVHDLSFAEVADALGMTPVAARKTLSRARDQFRAHFLAQEGEE